MSPSLHSTLAHHPPPDAELLAKHHNSPLRSVALLHLHLHLSPLHRVALALVSLQLLLLLLSTLSPSPLLSLPQRGGAATQGGSGDCGGGGGGGCGYFYVYDLPPRFNRDLAAASGAALSNSGFGPAAAAAAAALVPSSLLPAWFATDQFAAELIFHRRLLSHRCRTLDPSAASAFYIPFYAGLAVARHLWSPNSTSLDRDRDGAALLRWIQQQPWYNKFNGCDHFITIGRITWDFRRSHEGDWGSSFLYMPGMENITRLLIERNPWDDKDVGIPYPTGFHPRTAADVRSWARFVLNRTRPTLFSFAGATRAKFNDDFRGLLLQQCTAAGDACRRVDCGGGRSCGNSSAGAVWLFLDSVFCLQPRGDSFTRRSLFDCMVAGAIPVLFWRRSAYSQYGWYLPGKGEEAEWSVFIDRREVRGGNVSVREVLEGIGADRVRRMRERIVEMMPRLVYAATAAEGLGEGMEDAVDVAVNGVLRRIQEPQKQPQRRNGG